MVNTVPLIITLVATGLDGVLAGASLDQSLKQLPARHRMGASAFSTYSRAADLSRNGILWYSTLGIGAALLTIAAAVALLVAAAPFPRALPVVIAAILAVLHSLVTARAAPTNFRQRSVLDDEKALAAVFDQFERWQTLRAVLQVLTFGAMLWGLFGLR